VILKEAEARSILTRTGGFLHGFSHSLNPYKGCSFGKSLCGAYCYAPAVMFQKEWGDELVAKTNAAALYKKEIARERKRGPVRIFMASVTDPYVPQEKRLGITRAILEAMVEEPPEFVALQTHTPGPLRDLDLLRDIPCTVQITVETDRDEIPGLPPHAYPPQVRLDALRNVKEAGLPAVGVVAPLMPLDNPKKFAQALDRACTRVILDHYLIGDGSREGARTKKRGAHAALIEKGFESWTRIEALHEFADTCKRVLGAERVGVSIDGFNAP
jgi:DNA repair photolyase